MEDRDQAIEIFGDYLQKTVINKLAEVQKKVSEIEPTSIKEVSKLLREANSIISFACGGDDELYEEWKYRLFQTESGKLVILQGKEINTEYRKR